MTVRSASASNLATPACCRSAQREELGRFGAAKDNVLEKDAAMIAFIDDSGPRHSGPAERTGIAPGRTERAAIAAARRESILRFVVSNVRSLLLPWIRIPNLASHLISRAE